MGVCYPRHLAEAAGSGFSRVGLRVGIISFKRIGGPEVAHDRFGSAAGTLANANASGKRSECRIQPEFFIGDIEFTKRRELFSDK